MNPGNENFQGDRSSGAFHSFAAAATKSYDDECAPCRNLLLEVLERSESRPRTLVASMFPNASTPLEWRPTRQGAQIRIPTNSNIQNRQWLTQQQQQREEVRDDKSNRKYFNGNNNNNISKNGDERKDSLQETSTEWLNVSCQVCPNSGPQGQARAYILGPQPLEIVVCSNRLQDQLPYGTLATAAAAAVTTDSKTTMTTSHHRHNRHRTDRSWKNEMEEILTHELVHAYDVRALQLDLRDCSTLAYSEVRAAREAECANSLLPRDSCVREIALRATQNLFRHRGRACLNRVFSKAMQDLRPFAATSTTAAAAAAAADNDDTTQPPPNNNHNTPPLMAASSSTSSSQSSR